MALRVWALTDNERATLTRSRTAPARLVEHAQLILQASQGRRVAAIAADLRGIAATVRTWLIHYKTTCRSKMLARAKDRRGNSPEELTLVPLKLASR